MKVTLEVIDGVLQPCSVPELKNGLYEASLTNIDIRTMAQNNALYLWLSQIANQFNRDNVTADMVIKPQIEWSKEKIKAMFFDPVMKIVSDKNSSTKLNKDEFQQVLEVLTEAMGRKGQELPEFPSIEVKDKG